MIHPMHRHDSHFFGKADITALRAKLADHLREAATNFLILIACLWMCHTLGLWTPTEEDARLIFVVNWHSIFDPPLSKGFYRRVVSVLTTAGRLCENPLE